MLAMFAAVKHSASLCLLSLVCHAGLTFSASCDVTAVQGDQTILLSACTLCMQPILERTPDAVVVIGRSMLHTRTKHSDPV